MSDGQLGPRTARAADWLERHLKWAEGFWLGFVFTIEPRQAHVLQTRASETLAALGQHQRVLRPQTPHELETVLAQVLADGAFGCTWVEAIRERDTDSGAWRQAWIQLILRANERRELLRGGLTGGLVFVAHPALKPDFRVAGPDLWSIRSRVFELPAAHGPSGDQSFLEQQLEVSSEASTGSSDAELLEEDLRRWKSVAGQLDAEARARTLLQLARRLRSVGRLADATDASEAAVDAYRQLPDRYLPELATALDNLGNRLSEQGRWEEAGETAREAVAHYRALTKTDTDAFVPGLASALNNLGNHLGSTGQWQQAMDATKEAVVHYRALVKTNLAYLPELAAALNNLGIRLHRLEEREEAMSATQEAVKAYRALVKLNPDAYLPDLASALDNLGIRLLSLGRLEEAIAATSEAAGLHRKLAEERPDAFLPKLATTLTNLGVRLYSVGQFEEALAAAREAVAIRRDDVAKSPGGPSSGLARSLALQGNLEHLLGDDEASLESLSEALYAIEPFYRRFPSVFTELAVGIAESLRTTCKESGLTPPADLQPLLDELSPPSS